MAEEPIIVRGSSVSVEMSDKLKDNGVGAGRKKFKSEYGRLLRLQVNGETPRPLNPTDVVTIIFDDGDGQG